MACVLRIIICACWSLWCVWCVVMWSVFCPSAFSVAHARRQKVRVRVGGDLLAYT